ncbi:MAG: ABC transporter substrate-binding protein [Lysinibacillus sp.]
MNFKKFSMFSAAAALTLALAACGGEDDVKESEGGKSEGDTETTESFKVGVSQFVTHPSLDAATEGFKAALKEAGLDVEYVDKNANGEQPNAQTIAQEFTGSDIDLIFANATPSAQAAAGATKDIPIVFTSVTDAIGAELIASMEAPGGNVTGTVDLHPDTIAKTVEFLVNEIGAKKVGTVYNTGEQNSVVQIDAVKKALEDAGVELVEAAVSTSAEVKTAAESLVGKVDSFYIITDNTVVSALESVVDVANSNKLPMMVGELDSVARGGLGAYGFSYYDIGFEAGQKAVQILKDGKSAGEIPATYPANLTLNLNKATLDNLGLELKESWGAELVE